MPKRASLKCKGNSEDVFTFLSEGGVPGLRVVEKDKSARVVTLATGPSLFSWGERIEITVSSSNDDSILTFRGSRVHPLNLTSDVDGALGDVVKAIKNKYGIEKSE